MAITAGPYSINHDAYFSKLKTFAPARLIDLAVFSIASTAVLLPPRPLDPTERVMERSHSEGLF